MLTLLAMCSSTRGSISPLSYQPLLRQQKSPSCINGGFLSMRSINHNERILWLNETTSFKGSAAARDVSASSGSGYARKIVDKNIHHDPDLWENQFHIYDDPSYEPVTANEQVKKEHEVLKQEVWRMLMKIETTPRTSKRGTPLKTKLRFIDTLQRIGVSFHFEKEIGNILQKVHKFDDFYSSGDLYTVSTAFRLLRDQGIYVPARGMFDKLFLEHATLLNEASSVSSSNDIDGLLALYEASFCVIPDDKDILNRAQEMASNKLKSILQELERNTNQQLGHQCEKIKHVLCRSIKMNCERLVARFYISIYKKEQLEFGESLLKFAVHDFNIRQAEYQRELGVVTKWCEETNLKKTIGRHRAVECHYWQLCISSEPQFNIGRIIGAKFFYLITLIDDMYDTFGTIEENELFTEAFAKLDPSAPKLKPHMKALIRAMNSVYDETDRLNPGRPYMLYYLKREAERFLRAYENVGRWIYSKTVPTYEEYFDVAMITGGLTMFHCVCFAGMGEVITEEVLSLTLDYPLPKIIEASSVYARLLDDDKASVALNELVDTTIAILVFAKHYGVSEEKARQMTKKRLWDAFKEINNSMLKGQDNDTIGIPRSVLKVVYGHIIANEMFNRGQDFFTIPSRMKDDISSIYVDPVVF